MTEPVFWTGDPGLTLPSGRPCWITPEMTPPLYRPHVVTTVFFARSWEWLRAARYHHGIADDALGELRWEHYGNRSIRLYSLHNIERLTYVLAQAGVLKGIRAAQALTIVLAVARQYGYGEELDEVAREAARERT